MTATRMTVVTCDEPGCGIYDDLGIAESADAARNELEMHDWQLDVVDPTRPRARLDFCPEHRRQMPEPEPPKPRPRRIHQHEHWQIRVSASGGWYCAACGAKTTELGGDL